MRQLRDAQAVKHVQRLRNFFKAEFQRVYLHFSAMDRVCADVFRAIIEIRITNACRYWNVLHKDEPVTNAPSNAKHFASLYI